MFSRVVACCVVAALALVPLSQSASAATATSTTDFPDPFVLNVEGRYFAFATNVGTTHVPVRTSVDLSHWQTLGDALPNLPDWAQSSRLTWAPSVLHVGDHYVMYVSVWNNSRRRHCIATASALHPAGPYALASTPLICGTGAIDASPFRDQDGSVWLTWKYEAGSGQPTRIVSRQLSSDREHLLGRATVLVAPTLSWENGVVEGPSLVRWHGSLFLFYAASNWSSNHYATGFAVCASARGPCAKSSTPMLATKRNQVSPGGLSAFRAHGRLFVAFHVWRHGVGYPRGARSLVIGRVGLVKGVPRLVPRGR